MKLWDKNLTRIDLLRQKTRSRYSDMPDDERFLSKPHKEMALAQCPGCEAWGWSVMPHCGFCGFPLSKTNFQRLLKKHETAHSNS